MIRRVVLKQAFVAEGTWVCSWCCERCGTQWSTHHSDGIPRVTPFCPEGSEGKLK